MLKMTKSFIRWTMAGSVGIWVIITPIELIAAAPTGLALYKKACKKCHGQLGEGKKSRADPSKFKYPPINQLSQEYLGKILNKYREMWENQTFNKTEKRMAKLAGKLSDEDIQALVEFITSQLKNQE